MISCNEEDFRRQLGAQYPSLEVMNRSAIMGFYDATESQNINQMWINVRCFNLLDVPTPLWATLGILLVFLIILLLYKKLKSNHRP